MDFSLRYVDAIAGAMLVIVFGKDECAYLLAVEEFLPHLGENLVLDVKEFYPHSICDAERAFSCTPLRRIANSITDMADETFQRAFS